MTTTIREPGFGSTTAAPKQKGRIIIGCTHHQLAVDCICPAGLTCGLLQEITPMCPALDPEMNCIAQNGKFTIRETVMPEDTKVVPTLWGPVNE